MGPELQDWLKTFGIAFFFFKKEVSCDVTCVLSDFTIYFLNEVKAKFSYFTSFKVGEKLMP